MSPRSSTTWSVGISATDGGIIISITIEKCTSRPAGTRSSPSANPASVASTAMTMTDPPTTTTELSASCPKLVRSHASEKFSRLNDAGGPRLSAAYCSSVFMLAVSRNTGG